MALYGHVSICHGIFLYSFLSFIGFLFSLVLEGFFFALYNYQDKPGILLYLWVFVLRAGGLCS